MSEIFITLNEAAYYEGTTYNIIQKKVKRYPEKYITQELERENGGRKIVLVAVSSLSLKAQKQYFKEHPLPKVSGLVEAMTKDAPPWYVTADPFKYFSELDQRGGYPKELYDLNHAVCAFIRYCGEGKTEFAKAQADKLGMSLSTFYKYVDETKRARCWREKLEREGQTLRANFEMMALVRKPREKDTFPSLDEDMKKRILGVLLDKTSTVNQASFELLYDMMKDDIEAEGREDVPTKNIFNRYCQHLINSDPIIRTARKYLMNGPRGFENKYAVKGIRSTKDYKYGQYFEGDAVKFDLFVKVVDPDGKARAIRPMMAAWMDLRTRTIHGAILCEDSNQYTIRESIFKVIHEEGGLVPENLHMDNGKDYTAKGNMGQSRKKRVNEWTMDDENQGFYQAVGINDTWRSLPHKPWDKAYIERWFNTLHGQLEKRFPSYVGTLTGSKTGAKIEKDIDGMLARNELPTMEEFAGFVLGYIDKYHHTKHKGLKANGETYTTPFDLMQHCKESGQVYVKVANPIEYDRMQLLKQDEALVITTGIRRNNTTYFCPALSLHVGEHVTLYYDEKNPAVMYVYDKKNKQLIGEATEAGVMRQHTRNDPNVENIQRIRKRTLREIRQTLADTKRDTSAVTPEIVLSISGLAEERRQQVVSMPRDPVYRQNARQIKEAFGTKGFEGGHGVMGLDSYNPQKGIELLQGLG